MEKTDEAARTSRRGRGRPRVELDMEELAELALKGIHENEIAMRISASAGGRAVRPSRTTIRRGLERLRAQGIIPRITERPTEPARDPAGAAHDQRTITGNEPAPVAGHEQP